MKIIDLKSLLLGAALSAIVFATIAATSSTESSITDYEVVFGTSDTECSQKARNLLKKGIGWQPLGGVAVSTNPLKGTRKNGNIYAQALVR